MAVYKRAYRPYEGAYTPLRSRFMVIPRFAWSSLFESRVVLSFYFAAFIPALLAAAFIYIVNSPTAQAFLSLQGATFLQVNNLFFMKYLVVQAFFCFLFAALIGPGLMSVDFANDALPLFLSRPISRADYLLGKFTVIAAILSTITWIPALLLFFLQASLTGFNWFANNLWIAGSIVLGSVVWIIVLTLLVLALSAWVRWKVAATALTIVVFFVIPGFGEAINEVLRTYWGKLLNLSYLIGLVWTHLFDGPLTDPQAGTVHPRFIDLPLWVACLMLTFVVALSIWMLHMKLKPREVVR